LSATQVVQAVVNTAIGLVGLQTAVVWPISHILCLEEAHSKLYWSLP
jgi:hypothetical protein